MHYYYLQSKSVSGVSLSHRLWWMEQQTTLLNSTATAAAAAALLYRLWSHLALANLVVMAVLYYLHGRPHTVLV